MESTKKEKDTLSIPIFFKSKELYIGKGSIKQNKSSLKFTTLKNQSETTTTPSKYSIKEFTLINKDPKKSNIIYKGREAPQDSCYVLMKLNSDNRTIQMYPANKWANFVQSMNYNKEKIENIEDKKKKDKKEKLKNFKELFNFEEYTVMKQDKPRKKTRKKKEFMEKENEDEDENKFDDNNDDDDDDDGVKKKKKKKNKYDFDEDSHSSEYSLDLKEDSYEDEIERRKEEEKLIKEEEQRKKKEEEKKKLNSNDEEEDDDDDKSFENAASDVDESEEEKNDFLDLLNKKKKRETTPEDIIKDELVNLLRKKNNLTYDDIMSELIKQFNPDLVNKYIDEILDEITDKFSENQKIYYYLK